MPFIVEVSPGLYEKRTSTISVFGGLFQYTNDIMEAKRLSRKSDADRRRKLLQQHADGYYEYKKQFQPQLNVIQLCSVKEL